MADDFIRRIQQIAIKQEATPGTAETLTAADAKTRPYGDVETTPDFNRFEIDEVNEDFGDAPDIVAGLKGSLSFGATLVGSGTVGTAPFIGRYLRACGCNEQSVETITIGAPTGGDSEFAEGEIYSATGSKAGIIEQTISGAGTLRYIATAGGSLADADVVTVSGDGDSATCSGASSDYGVRYSLRSDGHEPSTVARYIKNLQGTASQDFIVKLRGALGNATIEANAHDILRLRAELFGVWDSAAAGSLLSGISYETATPANLPKFLNATLQLDGVTLRPSAFTIDFGNVVELDPDPTTGGSTEGYTFARILDRSPTITIDPSRTTPGVFDDLGKLESGATFAFSFVSTGGTGQLIEIVAPAVQLRQWSEGDRSNLQIANLTLAVTRNTAKDTDLKIYFR